ncbi:hypothetical protein C5167_024351 [Papaver somniferum]|uniref:Uncharacterized protein n=1 Tax=Papaver somniferum TaxID=3469 RepID=A0A4Y7JRB6_PAPSO|nr:hypothetical protein C5167_024351 [Papaver somniferum]
MVAALGGHGSFEDSDDNNVAVVICDGNNELTLVGDISSQREIRVGPMDVEVKQTKIANQRKWTRKPTTTNALKIFPDSIYLGV